jgi:hypothetical protein
MFNATLFPDPPCETFETKPKHSGRMRSPPHDAGQSAALGSYVIGYRDKVMGGHAAAVGCSSTTEPKRSAAKSMRVFMLVGILVRRATEPI